MAAAVANVKNNSATQETRRRLLAAAGAVFADRGFHAATIQEITDRAGASLASVNYHFGDKAELYAAVLRRLAEEAAVIVPPPSAGWAATPADRLRQFIRHFVRAHAWAAEPAWEQVLMARELAEPTAALDPFHEQVMRPLSRPCPGLIAELLGVPPADPAVGLAAASVMGQCVYYMKQRHGHRPRPPAAGRAAGRGPPVGPRGRVLAGRPAGPAEAAGGGGRVADGQTRATKPPMTSVNRERSRLTAAWRPRRSAVGRPARGRPGRRRRSCCGRPRRSPAA